MKNIITFYLITLFILISSEINSQPYDYSCGTEIISGETFTGPTFTGGKYKPHRTDIGGAPSGEDRFPVLIVFVQFQNEPGDTTNTDINYWRPGFAPNFAGQTIRTDRNSSTNWWDSYNGYDFSDFWHESSRGKFHVIGRAVSVILPHNYQWYLDYTGGDRVSKINRDTYDELNGSGVNLNWPFFDQWDYNDAFGDFTFAADGRVDMLMKVHRHDPNQILGGSAAGYIPLGGCEGANGANEFTVYQSGSTTIKINGNLGGDGSGGVVCPKSGITDREFFLAVTTHEMGHYMWGYGHHVYSKMVAGAGGEFSLSPWEMIKMGYIEQEIVDYSDPTYALYDYSSRGGTAGTEGEILQVPIGQDGSEFFLIANRRKVSDWDRRMGGDTVPEKYLRTINPEYGKGLYLYHVNDGFNEPSGDDKDIDLECADGLWNWVQDGTSNPIWGQNITHPTFKKTNVGYDQDDPNEFDDISKDGMSAQVIGLVNGVLDTMGI